MKTYSENLLEAKDILGSFAKVGQLCGVSGKAVMKWSIAGRPPRTEYTGETNYAELISNAVAGVISKDDLLPAIGRWHVEIQHFEPQINHPAKTNTA